MAAIATNRFRVLNARAFINSLSNYYLFIGRPQAWASDTSPDTPLDAEQALQFVYDDMIAMKKMTASDRSLAIEKRDWTSGQYYNMYRHDYDGTITVKTLGGGSHTPATLADANYYVVASNNNVYVCLYAPETASTDNPGGYGTNSYAPINASDGYKWLFIGKPTSAEVVKFVTNDFFPIKTIAADPGSGHEDYTQWLAQANAVTKAGCVYTILITNGGTGYGVSQSNIPITVKGDGSGLVATAASNAGGAISAITISNNGTGYSWAEFTVGGTGNSATLKAMITPAAGLGANPDLDLNGFYTVVTTRLEYAEGAGTFPVSNDYRRLGLLVDPLQYGTTNALTATTANNCYIIEVDNPTTGSIGVDNIFEDDSTGARGIVVDVQDGTGVKTLKVIRTQAENADPAATPNAEFTAPNPYKVYSGGTEVASGNGINTVTPPDVEPNSGIVAYYENRRPITRADNQIEDIKVAFQF
jgi:hypothetical protein